MRLGPGRRRRRRSARCFLDLLGEVLVESAEALPATYVWIRIDAAVRVYVREVLDGHPDLCIDPAFLEFAGPNETQIYEAVARLP